ncbi:MAG: tetratricopeptide repeat protein [Vicinamibacterales bacterium]|nr:tetratricopeptide repeat protein [Vicinamibacterales bacterium]
MPPWKVEPGHGEFIGLDPLSESEIDVIGRWAAAGAPEGNPRDLPATPRWEAGWQLGIPDLVVSFPESYTLPASGPDVSRVFVIPLPVKTRRYVRGIEFMPGNSSVHHANIRLDATAASRRLDADDPEAGYDGVILRSAVYPDGHFLGWTPGQAAPLLPKGLAWSLAPASDLVVQMHMVPSGKPEVIRPSIGLYFTDDPPDRTPVMMRLSNQRIDIPPGDANYEVTDSFVLPVDVEVEAVQPHAHYLAREVRGLALLPDGSSKELIYIRDWDLRWQHVYRYVNPFPLPSGTRVEMRYIYDNSAGNTRNPTQPPVRVPWGQQSREEMGDFWLQVLTKDATDRETLNRLFLAKWMATDAVGLEELIRRQPSRIALRDDIGVLYMLLERPAEAAVHFDASLQLQPNSAPAHYNLATALSGAGRLDEAVAHYRRALELRPSYALAHNNLAVALLRLGQTQDALQHFRDAARFDDNLAEAHLNAGLISRAMGDGVEAAARLRRAVSLSPDWVLAVDSLASLLAAAPDAAVRNPGEAVRLAEHAVELTTRRDANALDIAAVAHASAGNFDRAITLGEEALALNPPSAMTAILQQHLSLFKQRRPYISPR